MIEENVDSAELPGVLIVDDLPENLMALQVVLGDLKIRMVEANSGAQALRLLLHEDFALILLDVRVPTMDGLETAALIRGRDRSRHTPIIFITAGGSGNMEISEAYSLGAVDYISKPFVPEILKAKVCVFIDLYTMADRVKRQALELAQEVEHRKQIEEEMRALSLVDELTGLYNRRGFLVLARQQMKMAERLGNNVVLFYGDLDGLKTINDTLGHSEGDQALIEMAKILRETCRESDVLARLGGDEFVALALEHSGQPEGLVARLEAQLEARQANPGHAYPLAISMGLARWDSHAPCSLEELMGRADTLMYQQKVTRKRRL